MQHELHAQIGCRRFADIFRLGQALECQLAATVTGQVQRDSDHVAGIHPVGRHGDLERRCGAMAGHPLGAIRLRPSLLLGGGVEARRKHRVAAAG